MFRTEVVEVGDALGVILPQELLDTWKRGAGDTIYALATDTGFRPLRHAPAGTDADIPVNEQGQSGNTRK